MSKLLISPSKIYSYNECPKKLEFRYVLGIPQDDQIYFRIGRNVESYLWDCLINGNTCLEGQFTDQEVKLANAIFNNKEFKRLIDGKALTYQRHYETTEIEGYSDIETDEVIIDIKTSSTTWNEKTIQKYKYQAKMYLRESGKKLFYFVIVNKQNYQVQCLKITTKNFDDLEEKIQEIKLAFELGIFPKKEGPNCFRCDYKLLCKNS